MGPGTDPPSQGIQSVSRRSRRRFVIPAETPALFNAFPMHLERDPDGGMSVGGHAGRRSQPPRRAARRPCRFNDAGLTQIGVPPPSTSAPQRVAVIHSAPFGPRRGSSPSNFIASGSERAVAGGLHVGGGAARPPDDRRRRRGRGCRLQMREVHPRWRPHPNRRPGAVQLVNDLGDVLPALAAVAIHPDVLGGSRRGGLPAAPRMPSESCGRGRSAFTFAGRSSSRKWTRRRAWLVPPPRINTTQRQMRLDPIMG